MYLMDSIAAVSELVRRRQIRTEDHEGRNVLDPALTIFPVLSDKLKGAPRFILDRDAIQAVVELSLGRPRIIAEALAHLRAPLPTMWVEWEEVHRSRLRDSIGDDPDPLRPIPVRLGFLLETDEGGRTGVATWVWESPMEGPIKVPNVAPIGAYFDFDATYEHPPERVQSFLTGNLAELWGDNPVQLQGLLDIWSKVDHRPSRWGGRYFEAAGGMTDERLALAFSDVYGEWIGIVSVLLLLTASRKSVDYRPVNRAKLNKHRARRREVPLLDHTEVVMHLNRNHASGRQMPLPLGHTRKSPRVHMVSRYLARRGDKHWLVEPYIRGSGETIHRVVKVKR